MVHRAPQTRQTPNRHPWRRRHTLKNKGTLKSRRACIPPPLKQPRSNAAHLAPSRSEDDASQWQKVKRPRTRLGQEHPKTIRAATAASNTHKSNSRNRIRKSTNKFDVPGFEVLTSFEDDTTAPISVSLPSTQRKPARRKYNISRKVWNKSVIEASTNKQQVRHPVQTLKHLSPPHLQVVLRSQDRKAKPIMDRLLHQVALIRAARANVTEQAALLDEHGDAAFVQQVQARLRDCNEPPPCTNESPIDISLRAILDQDEMRLRGALCFSWVDMATRAFLPQLYDLRPDQPKWNGTPLGWLTAQDGEVPCLLDASLAYIAACPSLQGVWSHITKDAPELRHAIQTAANQWRLFITNQETHRTDKAPTNPSHQ